MNELSEELKRILKQAAVCKKAKKGGKVSYLYIRVASGATKEELSKIRETLEKYGLHPTITKGGGRYYLLISRKNEVKKIIEEHIGVQNLPPQHRETYEKHYKNPSQWGLKYDLTTALKNPEKAKTIYYLLGTLAGHGCYRSQYSISIRVMDKPLQQKIIQKAKSLGLNPNLQPKDPNRLIYHVIINSVHLIRLHQEIQQNPAKLETIPEDLFWAYFEGLYETDGSLRLNNNYFEARIRVQKQPGPQILSHIQKRLLKMGIKASYNPYKKGYAYELQIKESKSIVRLFKKIDPIIKNPKTGVLSLKQIRQALKNGINPETISQQWRKRWKEYLEKYPDA